MPPPALKWFASPALKSFASSDRFIAEVSSPSLRPGYVLAGDEIFLQDRCRKAVLNALAPPDLRDFCLHDLDLAEISIFEALDRAQTPSLMAPFQVLFLRGLKTLYSRGSKKAEFDAIDTYFRSPNPQALLLFIADHLHLPADLRRMDLQDKERFKRIRETLGDWCGIVELAQVEEGDAARWVIAHAESQSVRFDPDAARELVDALGANMMLIAGEVEKLLLYVTAPSATSSLSTPVRLSSAPHTLSSTAVISTDPERAAGESNGERRDPRISPEPPQTPSFQPEQHEADEPVSPRPEPHIARVTLGDVETMVLAAKQRSLYELTDAISAHDRPRAVALLHGLLNASDGGEDAAIGHLYMLARTFRQMLIILERNIRDSRAIWQALWQGFRMPPFAAEDLIRQARRYRSRRDLTRALRLIARADLDLRSSPTSKRLVLECLILDLAADPATRPTLDPASQFAMEL